MWLFDDFYEILGNFLYNLVYLISYPFVTLFTALFNAVIYAYESLVGLFNAFSGLAGSIITFFTNIFSLFLPDVWTVLLMTGISIVVILRIYFFLKDVSILGFKL